MDVEKRLQQAVQSYWLARASNREKQIESGRIDAGTRGEVTGGTQMGALEATNSKKTVISQPAKDLSFSRFAAALRGHVTTFVGTQVA